jgi:cytochrome c556
MKFLSKTLIAATAVAFIATGLAAQGQAQDAAAIVKERTDTMKGAGGAAARINKAEDAKATVDDAKLIQANVKKLAGLWPAGSVTPDSRAKPEIWQNQDDFKAKLADVQKEADTLVALSDKGDLTAIKAQVPMVVNACNACHKVYRGPEKK